MMFGGVLGTIYVNGNNNPPNLRLDVCLEGETVWSTQPLMANNMAEE